MAVLILDYLLSISPLRTLCTRTPIPIEKHAHVCYLQPRPKGHIKAIAKCIVVPCKFASLCVWSNMIIQKVIRNHKRSRSVHISRRSGKQSCSAVRKLSICRQSQKGQNQYEGYAFDEAKVILFRQKVLNFIIRQHIHRLPVELFAGFVVGERE